MTVSKRLYLVILLGAPGAGKGTQAILAAEKFKLLHVEMSKLLEQRFAHAKPGEKITVNGTDYSIEDQLRRRQEGLLVETAVTSKILEQALQILIERGENIILEGFPRSIEQMEFIREFIDREIGTDRVFIFYLDVGEGSSLQRNSNRRICELMRHPILSHLDTEKLTICPLDGSRLLKRVDDDNAEVIKARLQEFKKQTLPLLSYFEHKGIAVHRINGEQSVADVFGAISETMNKVILQGL